MSGDFEPGEEARERITGSVENSAYPAIARSLTRRYDGSPCIDRGPNIIVQGAFNPWDAQSERFYPDNGIWHSLSANEGRGQSRDAVFCLQGNGIDRAETSGCNGKGWTEDVCYTLNTIDRPAVCAGFKHKASGSANGIGYEVEKAPSLIAGQESAVYDARGNGDGKTAPTLTGDHQNRVTDYTALCIGNGQLNQMSMAEQANTLDTMHDQQAVLCFQNTGQGWWNESDVGATLRTPCGGDSAKANLVAAVDCRNGTENAEVNGTLQAKSNGGTSLNLNNICRQAHVVRRLTPLECERLQGFPDKWTDIGDWKDSKGKKHKAADSPRYKALGNSLALPFWSYLAGKMCAQYDRHITLGSLFDGIGGFPLVFSQFGAYPVWASEIEDFGIAVTKQHFPESEKQLHAIVASENTEKPKNEMEAKTMADFIVTHRIEAPELVAALNNVAEALKAHPTAAPRKEKKTETPLAAPVSPVPAPVQPETPTPPPVETSAPATPPATVAPAPTVEAPTPVVEPAPAPAPAPVAPAAPAVTFDTLVNGGQQLMTVEGMMPKLMALLESFGVQALTQLKPEQYPAVADGLRSLGAKL